MTTQPIAVLLLGCVAACSIEPVPAAPPGDVAMVEEPLLGLRTGMYHVADLQAAKQWYARVLGKPPYFDEPFYVGFDVGGYELGLNPDTSKIKPGAGGAVVYWGVTNADSAYARLLQLGAQPIEPVEDVGGGIRHAIVRDPFGNLFGVIENPNFRGGS